MLASQKFTLRISPQENVLLSMLAAKLGRTKAGTLKWLVREAAREMPEQKAMIVKPRKKRN
jgi:hypothetical protein